MNPSLRQLEYQMPNKLFDAFVAGRAIIARKTAGEMGELLELYPAAISLEEVTSETLRAAFDVLRDRNRLRELQENASAAGREFNSEVAVRRLDSLFSDMVRDAPRSNRGRPL
jgi:hypothetical protein